MEAADIEGRAETHSTISIYVNQQKCCASREWLRGHRVVCSLVECYVFARQQHHVLFLFLSHNSNLFKTTMKRNHLFGLVLVAEFLMLIPQGTYRCRITSNYAYGGAEIVPLSQDFLLSTLSVPWSHFSLDLHVDCGPVSHPISVLYHSSQNSARSATSVRTVNI